MTGRGADVNAKDYKGCTPLRLARRYGQDAIESMLMEHGGKDEQEPPKRKASIGPDPPWMSSSRKSSAVATTRREGLSIGANWKKLIQNSALNKCVDVPVLWKVAWVMSWIVTLEKALYFYSALKIWSKTSDLGNTRPFVKVSNKSFLFCDRRQQRTHQRKVKKYMSSTTLISEKPRQSPIKPPILAKEKKVIIEYLSTKCCQAVSH